MTNIDFDERGAVGGLEGLAFGVLVFVFGTLLVNNAWLVIDAKLATAAASREAARSFVEASDATSAVSEAERVALRTLDGMGISGGAEVSHALESFARCNEVTLTATVVVPQISLPLIGGAGGDREVSSTHVEVVDPYRSGLEGVARC